MRLTNVTNVNFTAGKVHVYSDFDGTYCPASHSSLHNEYDNSFMKDYCMKMDKFFKATENDLHFHVTTGRTFGEYEAISHLLKMRGFKLPLPESFIAKNGSDEYIKNGTDSNFYEKGIFPYKYENPNKIKENIIEQSTHWRGEEIKQFIRNLANNYHLRFVEADSENSVKDYGNNSLYSEGKLNQDEWKKLPSNGEKILNHEIPIADYSIGARKDGNLKINLIFSPDYGFCSERNYIYDNFMNEIKNFLKGKDIKYNMQWEVPSKHNHYRNHCNITPEINNEGLTKLYDTRKALKYAITNSDMVITAGDGSNDFKMLNPLEYIEERDWNKYKENTNHPEFYQGDMRKKLEDLKDVYEGKNESLKRELETNGLLKKIEEIPIYSIIIKKDNSKLNFLKEVFKKTGKVIEVEKGELDKGIEKLIKHHSELQEKFKNAMSEKFKNLILGPTKKKKSYVSEIIIGSAVVLSTALSFLHYKINKEAKYESSTNQQTTKI